MAKEVKTNNPGLITFEDVRVENRKSFKPREELANLCIGKINGINLVEREVPKFNEEGVESNWQYAGLTIPSLEIEFEQKATDKDPHQRFYVERFQIVTTVGKDGSPVKADTVKSLIQDLYRRLQHINHAVQTLPGYKAPVLTGTDVSGSNESIITSFKDFFEAFVTSFNSVDRTGRWFWIKMVARISDRGNSYYGLPAIVNDGFIELFVDKRAPAIELKPNESVVLTAKKEGGRKSADSPETPAVSSDVQKLLEAYGG